MLTLTAFVANVPRARSRHGKYFLDVIIFQSSGDVFAAYLFTKVDIFQLFSGISFSKVDKLLVVFHRACPEPEGTSMPVFRRWSGVSLTARKSGAY